MFSEIERVEVMRNRAEILSKNICKIYGKTLLITVLILLCAWSAGCGMNRKSSDVKVAIEPYDKLQYEVFEVESLDIRPEIQLELVCDDLRTVKYYPMSDGLEIEKVYVESGDCVKKGDVLLRYKTDNIEKHIKEYEEQINTNLMLHEHYEKLNEIEPSKSMEETLERLNRSIQVDRMFIEELKAKLEENCVVAEEDGMLVTVEKYLETKKTNRQEWLFSINYSSGKYSAESTEDIRMEEGTISSYMIGLTAFDFRYLGREKMEDKYCYHFEFVPGDRAFCSRESVPLIVRQPMVDGAICIPLDYVVAAENGKNYVYVLQEKGFCRVKEVAVVSVADGMAVIGSGLSTGDEVVRR